LVAGIDGIFSIYNTVMNLNYRRKEMSKKTFVSAGILSGLLFAGSLFAKMQLVHYGHPITGLVVMTLGIIILVVPIVVLPRLKKGTNTAITEEPS
jgi:hypothetical protein